MTANRGNPGYTFLERNHQPLSPDHLGNERPTPENGRTRFVAFTGQIAALPGMARSAMPDSSVVVVVNRFEPPLARRDLVVCRLQSSAYS